MDHTVSLHFQETCFDHLLSLSSNQYCADCHLQNPDWISLSYGAIICQRCSGVHRSLGVQYTRVRSTKLDTWTLKNLYFMFFINNERINEYFEANIPEGYIKPDHLSSSEELADFIREKYISQTFIDDNKESPIDKANEKVIQNEDSIGNTDPEDFFKLKQQELEKLIKSRLTRLKPQIMLTVSSPQRDTTKGISQTSLKTNKPAFSTFNKRSLHTPSPPRFNNFLDTSHNKSPIAQTSFLSLFDGLNVKSSFKSNHHKDSTSSIHTDGQNSYRSQLSGISLNDVSVNPGEPIELNDMKSPPVKKKSQFFNFFNNNKENHNPNTFPSIDLEMEDWSHKDHHHDNVEPQRMNTIEGVDGIDFRGTLENIETPKLMTLDSLEKDISLIALPKMANHKSITLTLKEAEKSHTSTHLKRPSESFETPRMIFNEKLTHQGISEKWRKPLVIIGCLIIHLLLGYVFCWGTISPYVGAYFDKEYGLSMSQEYHIHVGGLNTLLFFGMALGFSFSEKVVNLFGMRAVSFVCFLALSAVLSLSGLGVNILLDILLMTLLPGVCIGIIYQIPFYCAVQYFPRHINLLRGFFFLSNGIGGFIIANLYPIILSRTTIEESQSELGNHIPALFEVLAVGILTLSMIGNVMIYPKVNFVEREWQRWHDKEKSLLSNPHANNTPVMSRVPSEILNIIEASTPISQPKRPIKTLLTITACYFTLPGFLAFSYKIRAEQITTEYTDTYLCLIGGIGMLMLALGRAIGMLTFKIPFKHSMKLAILAQGIFGLAYFAWGDNKNMFISGFLILTILNGIGMSILVAEVTRAIKGQKNTLMTGFVMLGFAISNVISLMIFQIFIKLKLEEYVYLGLSAPLLVALGLVMALPETQEPVKKLNETTRGSTLRIE